MASSSSLPTAIEFKADFPDDQLEEGRRIVRPGGMGISQAIANRLTQAGLSTSEPSLDVEHNSWEFFAERAERKFWVLVTDLAEIKLVQTKDVSPFLKRIFSGNAAYKEFLDSLHSAMSADARFSSLAWVT